MLQTDVDLGKVGLDTYIVAGLNDHIVPGRTRTGPTQLLGGESRFVLSTSGHIQAMVNPPAPDSRSSYRIAPANPDRPSRTGGAPRRTGQLVARLRRMAGGRASGDARARAERLGGRGHKATAKAPGTYVLAS